MMQSEEKHYKVVLIGTDESGKTALFNTFFELPQSQNSTIIHSIQNKSKYLEIEGKGINLEILNTPGASCYEILRRSTYKGTQALVFVCDITNDSSLQFISQEIQLIIQKELCSYDCSAILIGINPGGKERQISFQEISNVGNLFGSYHEVSINQKQKIFDIFKSIAFERLKFDNEDKEVKSLMQKIYENIDNPLMAPLKQKFQSKKNQQEKPQYQYCQAAPPCPQMKTQAQLKVEQQKKNLIKCLLIGDQQVGKSAICQNYVDRKFPQSYHPTIGVDFRGLNKPCGNKTYKLQIWDTAGIQQFKAITQAYYRGAKVALIVYDVTRYQSFEKAKLLISEFDKMNEEPVRYRCLVGNKSDLPRSVGTEEGMAVAQQFQTDFMEISAKSQEDLDNLFQRVLKFFHKNNDSQEFQAFS